MKSERDTHFANAAKLLVDKTLATKAMDTLDADRFLNDDDKAELQMLFAQFSYDLIEYILGQVATPYTPGGVRGYIRMLQDMTEWPERERFANALADLAKIEGKLPPT